MHITIDPHSATPPYEQVRLRIAALAADGTLAAGTRLPPVRQLATDLHLAANTVARAYKELEQAGLVETRGRAGTVITARATGTSRKAQQAALAYAETTRALGIPAETALALVKAALETA
ncbi:DNA-binding transcriptional regulator YhcF (GntR family) [Actinoplanes octamycinicus]|uniref:DNA-binding transcriptional regulator YhcF (GntR family) n=1 Tax=Actinoplanes octamycinicus TaxID=135948 RepID=A0A7W7H225_9ACTN|nr:GntR family transcriptional regulator [Actinoplanes octamycinicus]MBB4742565.1 DNA-binding transcriptional regulator YhcF (GntR family) [Actinoplanes octamycinicus]GIE60903.1 GntR family transcriptional regulator [Actinoplanes octamycinicus]